MAVTILDLAYLSWLVYDEKDPSGALSDTGVPPGPDQDRETGIPLIVCPAHNADTLSRSCTVVDMIVAPKQWTLYRSLTEIAGSGFAAAVYDRGADTVLAIRGTDGLRDFVYGNVGNSLLGLSSQFFDAVAEWADVSRRAGRNLYITGHSLGGALTALLTATLFGSMRDLSWSGFRGSATFCAPGVSMLSLFDQNSFKTLSGISFHASSVPVANVLVRGDLVSNLPGVVFGKSRWVEAPPSSAWIYKRFHSMSELAKSLSIGKNADLGKTALHDALDHWPSRP